ncbi:cell wall-binding repeat-containing protein [Sutcliffiella deserti]|uniref:cell wall-binding repeat-containing protein n=1 Tax=Sutcliffiella deserti TaxID=2875501 RepID=UPI001CC0C2DA|nr:cell wall-binding repeat-containing protein [Sutcliffiella deserti]
MKRKKEMKRPVFASLLSFLLIFSMMVGNVGARENTDAEIFLKSKDINQEVSVSDEVYKAFKKEEYVELLVEMRDQVDTTAVALQAREQINPLLHVSPFQKNLQSRFAVVDALKSTAENTQKTLLQMLESSNQVKDVKSYYIMNVIYVKAKEEVVEQIKSHPEVANVRLDAKIEMDWPEMSSKQVEVSVHKTTEETILQEGDNSIEWNINKIEAPRVWNEFGIDGSGVVIGMIDTGAHWSHEALKEKWRGFNPLDPNNPNPVGNWFDAVSGESMPYDLASTPHGSHVLGTILGQDPEGKNKIGVAPGSKWIAARAFTEQGGQDSWLLAAGQFMLAPNGDPNLAPDIINNSWGGGSGINEWFRPMVQAWRDAGILPVFSAGNAYPSKVSAPANYPESYAVAATDSQNIRGSFSSVGAGPYADDLKPDIAAPGVNIRSSVPTGYEGGWNGTSMASPHIAGVAALLRSVDASLSPDQLEEIINETALPLTDSQYSTAPNYGYGNGLVNAYDAVASIASGIGGISGQVLKQGVDEEEPVINHQPYQFGYSGLDFVLDTQISDNVSVVQADLYVRQDEQSDWEIVKQKRSSGDFRNGNYQVEVPLKYVKEPGFQYLIKAIDFSGNEAVTEIFNVEISFGINPSDSFEFNFEDYLEGMLLSGDWEWGVPTVGTTPRSGEKLVATKLTSNYSDNSNSLLQFPPIDTRNADHASLSFKHWFDIEYTHDQAKVLVTNDIESNDWHEVTTFTGRERAWEEITVNLDQFAGSENQVFVALLFNSDDKVNHAGWYIDDLTINNTSEATTEISVTKLLIEKPVFHSHPREETKKLVDSYQNGLPVEAFVTVIETGRTVKTSLEDGSYHILHRPTPEGENYTLRVESYGYYPQQEEFNLQNEEVIDKNFLLAEIPTGEISINVINKKTQEPIQGVALRVLEDGRIPLAETDSQGFHAFADVLEGTYTVSLSIPNYQHERITVDVTGGESSSLIVELTPFPGSVITYDDGTAENAKAYYDSGYGFATKMSPDKLAQLAGVSVYLWESNWPVPGGNQFSVAVHESNENGEPGKRIIAPKVVEGQRGQWNFVDLSEFDYKTDKDYFVVVLQTGAFPNVPGIGIDESSPFADRSYQMDSSGVFSKLGSSNGNFMIRSHLYYLLKAPTINDATDTVYVKENIFSISGHVEENGTVNIYNDDVLVATTEAVNQEFEIDVDLNEGENKFTATVTSGEVESSPSNSLIVVKDVTKPIISIVSPQNGISTNEQVVTVTGTLTDNYLSTADINGEEVAIKEEGVFSHEVTLNEGLNEIFINARDLAGNEERVLIEVTLDTVSPVISSVNPDVEIYRNPGDSIVVTITSDTRGGTANLLIKDESEKVIEELVMEEVEPFIYEATWSIPMDATFSNATFNIEHFDSAGNQVKVKAAGSLNLIFERVERLFGNTRYETAVKISEEGWDSADVVVLARGDVFADALAGIPLAHKLSAPMLLTRSKNLDSAAKAEIERLGAKEVIILGGIEAIEDEVAEELTLLDVKVSRIAGASRYHTAALIAGRLGSTNKKAVVVSGSNFPDALSAASFAAQEGTPILLTRTNRLPEETRSILENNNIMDTLVIGGTDVITAEVEKLLPEVTRVSGSNRFATNIEVLKYFNSEKDHLYVATGRQFADALTGSALAAKNGTGLLLMDYEIPELTKEFIKAKTISNLTIFGGEEAVSNVVEEELERLVK